MTKSKKKIIAGIGLIAGISIFTGSVFASYNTSNGYEIGKNALKKLTLNENYTAEMNMVASIDGENIMETSLFELYDRNGDGKINHIEKNKTTGEYGGESVYNMYVQDGKCINIYKDKENNDEHVYINDGVNYRSGSLDSFYDMDDDDRNTANKIIRFAELIGDTMVGDLKNNVVYAGGDDNSSTYELHLDAMQIPEVINAGLSVMFSSINSNDYRSDEDFFALLGDEPVVSEVSLTFTVDKDGRLLDAKANAAMTGNNHTSALELSLNISDYGTTKPQKADISKLKNITYRSDEGLMYTVTEDGEVISSEDGKKAGHIEIQKDGEGVIVYD